MTYDKDYARIYFVKPLLQEFWIVEIYKGDGARHYVGSGSFSQQHPLLSLSETAYLAR